MSITRAMDKTPLFKDDTGNGLMWPGDPVRLLLDIEKAYPQMKV